MNRQKQRQKKQTQKRARGQKLKKQARFECKAVLFDLWETLAFSRGKKTYVRYLKSITGYSVDQHGGEFSRHYEKVMNASRHKSDSAALKALFSDLKSKPSEKEFQKALLLYDSMRKHVGLFPESKKVLLELQKRGFRLGLVTNTAPFRKGLFKKLGIEGLFDAVVNSSEEGVIKPDPKIFRIALKRLGAKPNECVMVGDKPRTDIKGAKNAGMKAILLDRKGKHKSLEGSNEKIKSLEELLLLLGPIK